MFLAETLNVIGEITIAYTVVKVHHRVMKEHRIDEKVFKIMRTEQVFAVVGICFILAGYILTILGK